MFEVLMVAAALTRESSAQFVLSNCFDIDLRVRALRPGMPIEDAERMLGIPRGYWSEDNGVPVYVQPQFVMASSSASGGRRAFRLSPSQVVYLSFDNDARMTSSLISAHLENEQQSWPPTPDWTRRRQLSNSAADNALHWVGFAGDQDVVSNSPRHEPID